MENNLKEVLNSIGLGKDRIAMVVRKEYEEDIVYYYEQFGWLLADRKNDFFSRKFEHLQFERDHFFPQKDALQYLEVSFEENVHKLNKAKKKKHFWSSFVFLVGLFLGLSLVAAGTTSFFIDIAIPLYGGIILTSASGVIFLITVGLTFPLFKAERKAFNNEFLELARERKRILGEVSKVRSA